MLYAYHYADVLVLPTDTPLVRVMYTANSTTSRTSPAPPVTNLLNIHNLSTRNRAHLPLDSVVP